MPTLPTFALPSFALPEAARRQAAVSAGLFVGVREFENGELPPVRFAADDAVDLAHLFALELGLIDPAKTVLLLAGEPQKEASRQRLAALAAAGIVRGHPWPYVIYGQLHRLGQLTAEDGLLVASFATHGFTDQGRAILAPAGVLRRRLVNTGLPLDVVLDDLGASRAKRRLLLVDACRERFEGDTRGEALEPFGDAFLQAMRAAEGCAILAGASQGGYAYDDAERGNGVFSGALIDGLRGEAPGDADALVTLESVAAFADARVRDWVQRHKPHHAKVSQGITPTYDPDSMRRLPLAIDGKSQRVLFEKQGNEALAQLVRQLGPRDRLYLEALAALESERPGPEHFELIREIAEFDGSPRHRRSLDALLQELRGVALLAPGAAPGAAPAAAPAAPPAAPPAASPLVRSAAALPFEEPPTGTHMIAAEEGRVVWNGSSYLVLPADSPVWAADSGRDEFGAWATLQVGKLQQRFRFVEPGAFLMGSPPEEPGRFAFEGPRHEVTLSSGYWLADTPCTQALFQLVEKRNPSQFIDPQRPVENVSWHSAQEFLGALSAQIGFGTRLPTEAEWEYACRAGTRTATYAGAIEILGKRNAPALDPIAWYGGNSGHHFDHKHGVASKEWTEKQYPHRLAGTRQVAQKWANPWGLFDMLGNVWEWCADAVPTRDTPYGGQPRRDPLGRRGHYRAYRGGSWVGYAARVRAAFRGAAEPTYKSNDLGFRIVIGEPLV